MRIICSHCHWESEVPYWQRGMECACPVCHRIIRLANDAIVSLGTHKWDVSYGDFVQLVTDPEYQDAVLPLVRAWLNYEVAQTSAGVQFRDLEGECHDAAEVHTRIQQNPPCQFELYQTAMSLWR